MSDKQNDELKEEEVTVVGSSTAYKPSFNDDSGLSSFDELDKEDADLSGIEDAKEQKAEQAKIAAEKAEQQAVDKAKANIMQVLDYYETGFQVAAHQKFTLDPALKEQTAAQLVPAARKYLPDDFNLNDFIFGKYGAEIIGAFAIYTLGKVSLVQIKDLKAKDAKIEAKKAAEKARAENDERAWRKAEIDAKSQQALANAASQQSEPNASVAQYEHDEVEV